MKERKSNTKITKKQAITRLVIAIAVVVGCVLLGINEIKRCFNLIDKNEEEIINKYYQVQSDYEEFKKEQNNTTKNNIIDEDENINTIEEEPVKEY